MIDAHAHIRAENMRHYGFGPEAMKQVKVCGQCGGSNPAKERHCAECGARLSDETLFDLYKRMHPYCRACGTVVADSASYCPKCGTQINHVIKERD